jgi:phage terminase large subunit-like protein
MGGANAATPSERPPSRQPDLLPHQLRPEGDDWFVWLLLGGRGSGKTFAGAYWTVRAVREGGAGFVAIVAGKTHGNTWAVCVDGPSGIWTLYKDEFVSFNRSSTPMVLVHENGGKILVFGGDEPTRFDGPECNLLWADELAVWPERTWKTAVFGVRRGAHPHILVTTTPKARRFVREIAKSPTTRVTRATMNDNPHTAQSFKDEMNRRFAGTRLGRQEIDGDSLDDFDGALWQAAWIDERRAVRRDDAAAGRPLYAVPEGVELVRVVVAVDPAGDSKGTSCETGLAVCARGSDGEDYVLASEGCRATPLWWGSRAVELYDKWRGDVIIGEANYGGEMVETVVKAVVGSRTDVNFRKTWASQGKSLRAEPVAARYEQGHVHHVGEFPILEAQMCAFGAEPDQLHDALDDDDLAKLKDRLDALVWALRELMGEADVSAYLAGVSYR